MYIILVLRFAAKLVGAPALLPCGRDLRFNINFRALEYQSVDRVELGSKERRGCF